MTDKYTRIFSLPQQMPSAYNCPVIVDAGALLINNELNRPLAQIKFRNVCGKTVINLTVTLKIFNSQGAVINESAAFRYANLNAEPGAFFGTQSPVYLNENNAGAFTVEIDSVQFSDGTVWNRTSEQIRNTAKAAIEHTKHTAMVAVEQTKKRVLPFILNLIVFLAFVICSISFLVTVSEDRSTENMIFGISFILLSISSFPGIGSILAKKENGKKLRIIRWIIVLLILVIMTVIVNII